MGRGARGDALVLLRLPQREQRGRDPDPGPGPAGAGGTPGPPAHGRRTGGRQRPHQRGLSGAGEGPHRGAGADRPRLLDRLHAPGGGLRQPPGLRPLRPALSRWRLLPSGKLHGGPGPRPAHRDDGAENPGPRTQAGGRRERGPGPPRRSRSPGGGHRPAHGRAPPAPTAGGGGPGAGPVLLLGSHRPADPAALSGVGVPLTDQRRARLLSALRRALPVLLTLGLIGLLLSQISPWDVVALLAHLSYPWVAAGVLCYVVTNAIRTLRFAALVRSRPIRLPRLLVTTFALSMFNNILPARSGELSFIYFMGRHHGVPAGEATATLIIARIFDYATVAALFVIVALASLARLPSYAARIISLVLFFLILSLAILVSLAWLGRRSLGLLRRLIGRLGLGERPLSASALRVGEGIACAFEAIPSSRTYLVVSLLSLLAWLGTFAWFACFLASMGVRTGLSQTIVGATFAVLSKALPFVTVGGLGTHEAGWTVGFMLVGFDKETAIATGFAVNILTLLSSLLFGLGGLGLWKWKGEGGKGKMERKNPLSIFPFPLSPLLAIFLALGVTYSVVNPLFEAPDEVWHTLYVKHLADGKGLPVHDLISEQPWRQEGSQPPLYYLAAALATAWVDTDDADAVIRYNPHAAIGLATAYGNKNVMAHTAWEAFPWRGTVLAAHLARLLSVLMGAGTVLCTYLLALEIFPGRRALAAGAAAINAFNPQFLFISAAINNDVAVTLFSSLALWLLVRTLRRGPSTSSGCHPSPRLLLALGIATGL
ncbi:MAG TPA: flippase-like domain-containing protein, partial [Anaerolineae bacterium]|nr:flippase-like domain-containing protein [Anaerolineae bacterium]